MANRIVVLEGGRIIEIGGHAELLARGGLYATLYRQQFGRRHAGIGIVTARGPVRGWCALAITAALVAGGGCGRTTLDPGARGKLGVGSCRVPSRLIRWRSIHAPRSPASPSSATTASTRRRKQRWRRWWRAGIPTSSSRPATTTIPRVTPSTIDANIGKHYGRFIGNYRGAFGPGSAVNRFWPSPGTTTGTTARWRHTSTTSRCPATSATTTSSSARFTCSPSTAIPASRTATSEELGAGALARGGAHGFVVLLQRGLLSPPGLLLQHHGSNVDMRWPFETWGADIVFAGHDHVYERSRVGGSATSPSGSAATSSMRSAPRPPSRRCATPRSGAPCSRRCVKTSSRFSSSRRTAATSTGTPSTDRAGSDRPGRDVDSTGLDTSDYRSSPAGAW